MLALAAVSALTGCSGSDKEKKYDVPESLCGTPLDPSIIAELLPSGKSINVQEKNPVPGLKRCQVNIDKKLAFRVSQEWWEEGDTVVDVAKGVPQVKSAELTDDSDSLLTGTGGVQRAHCADSERPGHILFTTAQVYADGVDDSAAMRELITEYTRAVEESTVCR
ncbi:hypothetical protein [Streptomyces sp. NWU49]|uniref:hypothetical protein n=1 Tax=Streptomyces sp. NWU49 TaxID=2201153 RepID=UPI001C63B7D4|nr:hypothetical protein [Streptomyces sp. NWU49]